MTRLTRWGHSCVRYERGSDVLVVDPGVFSDVAGALAGAAGVLVTHEHQDHVDPAAVVAAGVDVWAPPAVLDVLRAAGADDALLHPVAAGDGFVAAGFDVRVVGELHEVIHADVPRIANVGYLVAGTLHPGDAYVLPGEEVDVLLTPVAGPWLRIGDAIDYVRAVAPRRCVAIHDAPLRETFLPMPLGLLGRLGGAGEPILLGVGEGIDLEEDR